MHQRVLKVDALLSRMSELRLIMQKTLDNYHKEGSTEAARGNLPNFDIGT